jgi:thioesterase domain-containing protein
VCAYEVAARLMERGHEVESLFLLDPPFLIDIPPLNEETLATIFLTLEPSPSSAGSINKAAAERIVKVTDDIKGHFRACVDIVGHYTTKALVQLDSGPRNVTVVYASRDRDFETITTNDMGKWRSVFRDDVRLEMVELACSHFDVVRRPFVRLVFHEHRE